MENNNSGELIKAEHHVGLMKAGNSIIMTNKVLTPFFDKKRKDLVEFMVRNSDKEGYTIRMLSLFYPLNDSLIEKYKDKWEWYLLRENGALPWSDSLLEKYKDKWNWHVLSSNKALPWSDPFLEKYKDKWNWHVLSWNEALPCSEQLIEKYKDKWDWHSLSKNGALPWSEPFIEKYKDKWNWGKLGKNEKIFEKLIFPYINDEVVIEVMERLRKNNL